MNITKRQFVFGLWTFVIALVGMVTISFLPTNYVIQRPGPVFDTLGSARTASGGEIPLISITGAPTYSDTAGTLRLTTVQIMGNRERQPSWLDVALAWFDPSRKILSVDAVFPQGQSSDDRNQQNAVLMDESQNEATAAALRELGYEVPTEVEVVAVEPKSAADGVFQDADRILAVNGHPLTSTGNLRARVQESNGGPIAVTIKRGSELIETSITPRKNDQNSYVMGAYVVGHYEFPVTVTIQLDNVGGPSAGLMFSLGIIDQLTPGPLTGGAQIAGTGTIDSEGAVGPIGGIVQKLHGARNAGSTYFFAPEHNCAEVVGNIPAGLQVIRTSTLEDALASLNVISSGQDTSSLPSCSMAPAP
jgi:PDZ domain-containing protein